ncbi:ATP-dependent RNA helicase HrpA [Reinekea marinisedimentorum]|uniref:ATP-dependent helicase HrpA n=1 Tax=Reinekea marinisedimentorum TaxID=230495 RepID=A0A4R3I7C5_9GAMM|nr:ATP-dependent RNA helicase HrpA [Reinekea marinisedimentorum]TCS42046.1 ATP-dependent helicase HrpA [Reinekea marinisedimentorum]
MSSLVSPQEILSSLDKCLIKDRHFLATRCRRIASLKKANKPSGQLEGVVDHAFKKSVEAYANRKARMPEVKLAADLPVSEHADKIREAISGNQVVIVAGETGSGKTTQLPKICLQLGLGSAGMIGHTQPRRLAARSVAGRIAEELNTNLGELVGYQVRFTDQSSTETAIKLMTDGILLAEIQSDPYLNNYDTLIIDEAHERSLNIDFLLGYLKQLLPKRPDLKLIITSATIDVERFSQHFDNAPVIEVSGRSYPVDVLYRPMSTDEDDYAADLPGAILNAVEEIEQLERSGHTHGRGGDILVFLPGEREIREAYTFLRRSELRATEILPLYARLSASEQQRIFSGHSGRRIILSTNVAETSLTVPGIHYVIDSGLVRISRYSYRSKIQRLPIEPISQASANQRSGRCGRIAPGLAIRLYDEEEFISRPEFTDPEILRTNLASVILQMLHMRLGQLADFPFVEPPDHRMIRDGYTLLNELGAVNDKGNLTTEGKELARLPVDPRIGRMVIAANKQGALREVLIIASALSVPDPRERPQDKQQAATEKHAQDKDKESDFLAFYNLWQRYEEQRQVLSQNQLRKYCKTQFLNYLRMREWRDIHRQLTLMCQQLNYKQNSQEADYVAIHKSLMSGLLSHVATHKEDRVYSAARGKSCVIHPSSVHRRRGPKWFVCGEMVETTEVFARCVAKIEPAWLEPLAMHLVKRNYSEPHYEKKRGQVTASETLLLYGLPIVVNRTVNYGRIDEKLSREIFIRTALVEGELVTKAEFFKHNKKLTEDVLELEDKARRKDILVDEETLFQFYDSKLPENIVNSRGFHAWLKKQPKDFLNYKPELLIASNATAVSENDFPDTFEINGMVLPLSYHFEPGHKADGVTMKVPAGAVSQIPAGRMQWLVPGLLREKVTAMLKGLPKAYRKNFVPVPNYVDALMAALVPDETPLHLGMAEKLFRMTGVRVPEDEWPVDTVADHLRMRYEVVDERGKVVTAGRDLEKILQPANETAQKQATEITAKKKEIPTATRWQFSDLPPVEHRIQAGIKVVMYPALVDKINAVSRESFTSQDWSDEQHRQALWRLASFYWHENIQYLSKRLPQFKESALLFAPYGKADNLRQDMLFASVQAALPLNADMPRTEQDFLRWLEKGRADFVSVAEQLAKEVHDVLLLHHKVRKQIKGKVSFATAFIFADIAAQLDNLIYPGFIAKTPAYWRSELPRYLSAIDKRLNRTSGIPSSETMVVDELKELWQRYLKHNEQLSSSQRISEDLTEFRWMIEEYRVSLFAQSLKTRFPVSKKRLEKQWQKVVAQ